MSNPYVIILNGKPCTGKSYYLKKLSQDLDLSYISRDEFKELLFDELGIADQEWSKKLGGASYKLLFNMLEKLLRTKKSFILESNFNPTQHQQKLKLLIEKYGYQSVEVFLETESTVLFERHKKRWESGERHRGHVDNERFDEFEKKLKDDVLLPLGVGDKIIKVNTTDFNKVDYSSLKIDLLSLMSNSKMITGMNHITLSVRSLDESFSFYKDVLGFSPKIKWEKGAYFQVGNLWFVIFEDVNVRVSELSEYTHFAFSVAKESFKSMSQRIIESKARIFQENSSEGDSLYFLDPNGHKLEIHCGDLKSRLNYYKGKEGYEYY